MKHLARISDLPTELAEHLSGADAIVFDGECVLCSGFFRFILRHDKTQRFRFATAQSALGQGLYQALDLPADDFETNLVIVNGRIFGKLDAFAVAMSAIGWPWRALSVLQVLPRVSKDPAYSLVARNRYRLFGRYEACMIPSPDLRARFLPGGWE